MVTEPPWTVAAIMSSIQKNGAAIHMGADWNMTPQEVADSGVLETPDGRIMIAQNVDSTCPPGRTSDFGGRKQEFRGSHCQR